MYFNLTDFCAGTSDDGTLHGTNNPDGEYKNGNVDVTTTSG
jgi:hypothetical protein